MATTDPSPPSAAQPPPVLEGIAGPVRRLEADARLDAIAYVLERAAPPVAGGAARDVLGGAWLGHALHPLLSDFPLGCWLASGLLDLVGGTHSRSASRRLVGLGLVFVPVTAASGMADWSIVDDRRVRRVGVVHSIGNVAVALLYYCSWRSRRR